MPRTGQRRVRAPDPPISSPPGGCHDGSAAHRPTDPDAPGVRGPGVAAGRTEGLRAARQGRGPADGRYRGRLAFRASGQDRHLDASPLPGGRFRGTTQEWAARDRVAWTWRLVNSPGYWDLAKPSRRAVARHAARPIDAPISVPRIPASTAEPVEPLPVRVSKPPKAARCPRRW